MKTQEQKVNSLSSTLSNMITEIDEDRSCIFSYFSEILLDADVDSKIIVEVLEKFGELGKDYARNIKVSEGW